MNRAGQIPATLGCKDIYPCIHDLHTQHHLTKSCIDDQTCGSFQVTVTVRTYNLPKDTAGGRGDVLQLPFHYNYHQSEIIIVIIINRIITTYRKATARWPCSKLIRKCVAKSTGVKCCTGPGHRWLEQRSHRQCFDEKKEFFCKTFSMVVSFSNIPLKCNTCSVFKKLYTHRRNSISNYSYFCLMDRKYI